MKELIEICQAFAALVADGKSAALATVIGVEGSAYRQPGARMLIAEDGRTWGGVSGGCIDRDVAARGRRVITTGKPQRCRYESGDDDGFATGASTGCGGTVELFIQTISHEQPGPLTVIEEVLQTRTPIRLQTLIATGDAQAGECIATSIDEDDLDSSGTIIDSDGTEWFIEQIAPPQSLVVFGSGPDVSPVSSIAKTLGWHVTIVGAHPATNFYERFVDADVLHVTSSDSPCDEVEIPDRAAVVIMTHNVSRDASILKHLPADLRYVGLLGPRHRTAKILDELANDLPANLHAPIGLDLGGDRPEEIALSIIAEIQTVLRGGAAVAASLRRRRGPIHAAHREPSRQPCPV